VTAPSIAEAPAVDDTLHCYRHPDRETWVRCGRCDRPICPSCAMQGPVGLRCRTCGRPAYDPLTSFTPIQIALGAVTAVSTGLVAGYLASRIGFLSVIVAYFAGGIIAEIVSRVTGYKRGPVMLAIVIGGILVGTLLGAVASFWLDYGFLVTGAAGDPGANEDLPLQSFLIDAATWALVSAGAACVGAWQKLRW
jgi:MFS family permease